MPKIGSALGVVKTTMSGLTIMISHEIISHLLFPTYHFPTVFFTFFPRIIPSNYSFFSINWNKWVFRIKKSWDDRDTLLDHFLDSTTCLSKSEGFFFVSDSHNGKWFYMERYFRGLQRASETFETDFFRNSGGKICTI